ncbi:hypothetical protein OIO90_005382 [Microbotryomycetes sp. JL221]|nr:hypothetical protein OIO90_005382 [Microbotryomycetes sp. JL221]
MRFAIVATWLAATSVPLVVAQTHNQQPKNPFTLAKDAGQNVVKRILTGVFKMDDKQASDFVKGSKHSLEPHPYIYDLTDENWDNVLRSGKDDPFAPSLSALGENTVWIVHVYADDPISKISSKAFEQVASHNSSQAGGTLPSNFRLARINYGSETVLPTRWWLWKPPVVVIATDNLQQLRFFTANQVPPYHEPLSNLIAAQEFWQQYPTWNSLLSPGGSLEPAVVKLSHAWAWWHSKMSSVPHFVLLMISGFIMNFVVSWFHKPKSKADSAENASDAKQESAPTATEVSGSLSSTKRDQLGSTRRRK